MKQRSFPSGILRLFYIIQLILLTSSMVFGSDGSSEEPPRLEPDPLIVSLAGLEEPMDTTSLINTALIASGVPGNQLSRRSREIRDLFSGLPERTGDLPADGEALLLWMHENLLTRYIEHQTRLDVLLDEGSYNCVSSAVLYLILATEQGIPVFGVQTTDHAFCRVPDSRDPQGGYDVETTIAYGFDPGRQHDAVDKFTGRTGFVYVPPSNYRNRTDLGSKQLIALIYQNRLAGLQRSGQWTEAVGLARDRWVLAGSPEARNDFLSSLSNYAAEMNRLGRQIDALEFLTAAARVPGMDGALEDTARTLLHNAVTLKLQAGDPTGARRVLENQSATALVPPASVQALFVDIETAELENLVSRGGFAESVAAVDAALASGLITRPRWESFTLHLWSREARSRSSDGNWLAGWRFLQESSGETRRLLDRNRVSDAYEHNAVVIYHNDAVTAIRRGDFSQARRVIQDGLGLFPGNPTLEQDLQVLNSRDSR